MHAAAAEHRVRRFGRMRLIVFAALLVLLWLGTEEARFGAAPWILAALAAGLFVWLVSRQRAAEGDRRRAEELAGLNRDAVARVERRWDAMPQPPLGPELLSHPLARDLALTGRASLFQLLGTAWTPTGRSGLAGWLLRPAPAEAVGRRQEAVRELSPLLDFRQELELQGRRMDAGESETESFLRWAEGEGWLLRRPALVWTARLLPVVLLALIVAAAAGPLPSAWAAVAALVNLGFWLTVAGRVQPRLRAVSLGADELERWRALLRAAAAPRFESRALRRLQESLVEDGAPAHLWVQQLRAIVHLADVRYAPMIHFPLQLFTLWDVHVLLRLERWQEAVGGSCRDWLESVGELDALCALAGLAHDNPEWVYPDVDPAAEVWKASALGHPLIRADERVASDVELGPPGTLLLVTGSNMSGKSTLLRAVGVNVALAQAGGPACCAAFQMPPSRLGTSFVVEDSLSLGISYFMAELRRLREVADEAERAGGAGHEGGRYLFLLDEILKGTNSGERQIAVERILVRLLEAGAAGAVSTHDLELAGLPALAGRMRPVHFRENFVRRPEGLRMEFDYLLRPGVAPTKNALKLLELVGL